MVDQLPLLPLELLVMRALEVKNKVETPTCTDADLENVTIYNIQDDVKLSRLR